MARTILVITLVGIITGSLLRSNFFVSESPAVQAQMEVKPLPDEIRQRILQATVQITMIRDELRETEGVPSENGAAPVSLVRVSFANPGIGTLVNYNGSVVIVTHDHWSQVDGGARPDRVQFHDDQGNKLLEIDGSAFQSGILYRDGGTLVIQAPVALANEVVPVKQFDGSGQVAPGDIVYVARQQPESEATVDLLTAQVTAVEDDGRHAVIKLRSTDGQTILPGDSGGGIWHDGGLVGNMWMTIQEQWHCDGNPEPIATVTIDRSRAAALSDSLLNRLGHSLDSLQEIAAVDGGIVMQ